MNPYLDEDLQALGEHARRFASGRVAPGFLERDKTRVLDRQLMHEMAEMGFIAPELPEEFGGQGLGCLAAGVVHEAIARADLSLSYVARGQRPGPAADHAAGSLYLSFDAAAK